MANSKSKEIIEALRKIQTQLVQHKVKSLFLFGSVVRGEARSDSDIDFLVEFSQPVGLFELIKLKNYLESIFHKEVDLVPRDSLREEFKDAVLKEAIRAA